MPTQQCLQEFGEACERGEGRGIRGGWRKRPLPPASSASEKPAKHSNPVRPRQKHSPKVSESAAFNRQLVAEQFKSLKSHR